MKNDTEQKMRIIKKNSKSKSKRMVLYLWGMNRQCRFDR